MTSRSYEQREGIRLGFTHEGHLVETAVEDAQREAYENLLRIVSGALKVAIDAHGPIQREWIGSAAKRVTSQLMAAWPELADVCPERPRT